MSEVQKIQEQIWVASIANKDNPLGYKLLDAHVEALYTLLMEKMPAPKEIKNRYGQHIEAEAHNNAISKMVSAIDELFGRTE